MKFDFSDSFLVFTISSFLSGLVISDFFLTDYLSYPYILTNFTPRKGDQGRPNGLLAVS